jgi:thiamine-phosphate diphosphorylase
MEVRMPGISRLLSNHSLSRGPLDLSLYLVANRPSFHDEKLFLRKVGELVKGGVSCVQLRDHKNGFKATLKTAALLKEMLGEIPLFINVLTRPFEVIREVGADGIYLEEPFPHSEARKLLGSRGVIGAPVKTMEDVLNVGNEVDYLSVKISPSKRTCPRNDHLWGMEGLRRVRESSSHRIVAIGGLNLECAEAVYRELREDDGIAMAGGLMGERDPRRTARKILAIRQRIREEA